MPFERPVASALRVSGLMGIREATVGPGIAETAAQQLIRTERQLFRGDAAARQTGRALNRQILYEVAPRRDGSLGRCDDTPTALSILGQTREYLQRNVVRATLNQKGAYEIEFTDHTELGDNETINDPLSHHRHHHRSTPARCPPSASTPVGSLKPSVSVRQRPTDLLTDAEDVSRGPVRQLTAEEVQRVESYLQGKDDSLPPPMDLLRAYEARLEGLRELSGATAALVNPPLSAKYHTGFVRPWDEYQAEIDIARLQVFRPFGPMTAFFIALVMSFTGFYIFYPHVMRNFCRAYELSGSR